MLQVKEAAEGGMTKENRRDLGRYIAELREQQGKSLRALAEAAGLSPSSLSDIENGRSLAQPDTLERLATALGIDWEDLYALAGYGRPAALPSFGPYLRSKYGDQLTAKELRDLERYFRAISEGKTAEAES
jgi:transcriptional regulator with XRE-family HTH domain